jgi:Ca2+-transporting ATPase
VETLGATTVILTDKTGTLTENRMSVRRLWVSSGEVEIKPDEGKELAQFQLERHPEDARLLAVAVLCNDASLEGATERGTGDPMELALLRLALHAGIKRFRASPE